jgi:hypothetical protein
MKYEVGLKEESRNSFNMMPFLIFATIFPIFIGLLLRFPKLIMEIKEKRQWSFDWIKVAAIGVPSLYIAVIPVLSICFGVDLLFAKEFILLGNTTLTTTAGIVSGYVLLDSLKK